MPRKAPRTLNLTKTAIEKLTPPVAGREYHYDEKIAGLAVCVTAAGTKTFYTVRRVGHQVERVRIGPWPKVTVDQARDEAERVNGGIASGDNPNDKRRLDRKAPTLSEVFEDYVKTSTRGKHKRPRKEKTTKEYRRQVDKYLAAWKDRKLTAIRRDDIEVLHEQLRESSGAYQANRVIALIKALFNFALVRGDVSANPAARITGFPEESRERSLSPEELPAFWKAVEAEAAADFFKVALLTGARSGNVRSMRWPDVDLAAATWKIPETKNGKSLTLPLTPMVVEVLQSRMTQSSSEFVFPDRTGTRPMPTPKHGWERILKTAGISNLRIHDLRRSLGSWQADGGSSLSVIGKSLGHDSVESTKIYARVQLAAVRASVDAAATAMLATVTAATTGRPKSSHGPSPATKTSRTVRVTRTKKVGNHGTR